MANTQFPILFKRRNDGSVQRWWGRIRTTCGEQYRTYFGILDGAVTKSAWTTAVAKQNTTAVEQAEKELQALYTKKRSEGFTETIADIDTKAGEYFKVMKAHHYADYKSEVARRLEAGERVYVQPKLDGMRCVARPNGLWTRRSKPINSAPHVYEATFEQYLSSDKLRNIRGTEMDGELYTHKLSKNFNKIISLAKKKNPTPDEVAESMCKLQYHVYDLPSDKPFSKRLSDLKVLMSILQSRKEGKCLRMVETIRVCTLDDIDAAYSHFVEQGYEGAIIRLDEPYQHKRTKFLLKYKEFQDAEFKVLGVHEGTGNRSGMAGYLSFQTKEGKPFTAGIMGTNDFRVKLLRQRKQVIGKKATIKYFAFTPDGIPRFPVVKAIRDYE
jgi:DNA ligase-1